MIVATYLSNRNSPHHRQAAGGLLLENFKISIVNGSFEVLYDCICGLKKATLVLSCKL